MLISYKWFSCDRKHMRLAFPTETERTQGKMEREKPDWSSNSWLEKNGCLLVRCNKQWQASCLCVGRVVDS